MSEKEKAYKNVFFVQVIDTYNNVTFMGVYEDLKDAENDIKEGFSDVEGIEELELGVYPSTFGQVFDTEILNDEGYLRVAGYIFSVPEDYGGVLELDVVRKREE